jgi:hypothetical protein
MATLDEQYQDKIIKAAEAAIRKIYEQSILEIAFRVVTITLKDKPFSLSLYPLIKEKIENSVDRMHKEIFTEILRSVEQSWALSNRKNDNIVDKRFAGRSPSLKTRQILYDPNLAALKSFVDRTEKGLDLSSRVWNLLDNFKKEMEQALGLALNKGLPAVKMASEIKQYLNNPDKLFRRVRSEEGKLVLSRSARDYHPGHGVYRSSFKNALRLTATENNLAYRTSDFNRWKAMPFVIGVRIHTSNNHPVFDICDSLEGLYPKDFEFTGWHPFCKCYATPELMSNDQYELVEDDILSGKRQQAPKNLLISKPPASFVKYLNANEKRIAGWSSKPYWIRNNKKYVL